MSSKDRLIARHKLNESIPINMVNRFCGATTYAIGLISFGLPVPSPVSKGKDPKLLKYRNAPQIESEGDSGSLAMSMTMSLMKSCLLDA